MYRLNSQGLNQNRFSTAQSTKPDSQFDWRVQLLHKSGGLKKDWFIGQDETPISKIKFELNKKICGAGTIEFAFLDFPIDADDYIIIYYKDVLVYRAIIDQSIDPKGGKAKLLPYSQRLGEVLINNSFTGKTIESMLNSIITDTQDDTGIAWLSGFIDTGETTTYTKGYGGFATAKKAIDDLVKELDDRQWGVTEGNLLTVYQPGTSVDEVLLHGDNPFYTDIEQNIDYSKIKATRYQVLKKKIGSGETENIGQVGYNEPYPPLDIEKLTRKKEKKFTADELIPSDSEALDFAYADLKANAVIPESIKLKNFKFDQLFPKIGKRYKVQDRTEYIRRRIINCDSLTADDDTFESEKGLWSGATIDTNDFTSGTGSVTFSASSIGDTIEYRFGSETTFLAPLKLNFMLKGGVAGSYLGIEAGIFVAGSAWSSGAWGSGGLGWSVTKTPVFTDIVNIPTGAVWAFYEYAFTSTKIQYIRFTVTSLPSQTSQINLDNIGLFLPHRKEYEASVVQANFTIKKDEVDCDLKLNDYDLLANDDLFISEKELDKLRATSEDN